MDSFEVGRKLPSSSTLTWRLKGEVFRLVGEVWDVDAAKRIVRDRPRPIRQLNIAKFRDLIGAPGQVYVFGIRIVWDKALSGNVNLEDPIIVAYGRRERFPIDGWHRIARALWDGIKTLPYVGLTKEESKRVYKYTGRKRRRRRTR